MSWYIIDLSMEPEHIITSENNNPPTNNIQEQISPLKSRFSKIKDYLVQTFFKIKTLWLKLPLKFRIVVSPLFIIALILSVYALTLNRFGLLDELRHITQEDIIRQFSEGWTKLEIPQREPPFFTLKPQTKSKYGILPGESFTLTSKESISESFIKENLESNVPVKITSVSSTEFRITTEGNIKNDEIVKLSIPVKNEEIDGHTFDRNYGWTFQTQGKFRVTTSIPGNEKTNVPLNTGIEIVFSQDDYKDPKNLISIVPSIEWRGERHSETYAIIPLKPLDPKTIYIVTLKSGLNLESRNDPITQDYNFSFQTQESVETQKTARLPRISLSKNLIQVSPDEAVTVSLLSSNWSDNLNLRTVIYKFTDSNQFIESRKRIDALTSRWWSYFAEDEKVETSDLVRISEMDLKLQKKENLEYVQLPEPLFNGYYLVQFWYEDGKKLEQLWIQSTDISAYTSVGRKQTLIWVNNIESGKPVGSAQITSIGLGSSYSTSDNGIAVFSTPQDFYNSPLQYIKVSAEGGELILPVISQGGKTQAQQKNANDYWSYLYHERGLYKPEDTVYFWGIIKERDTGIIPNNAEVYISTGYSYSYLKQTPPQASAKITPDPNGAFIGSISLTNLPKGYYSLNLAVENIRVTSGSFEITDYEKPEMKIEVSPYSAKSFSARAANLSEDHSFNGLFAVA